MMWWQYNGWQIFELLWAVVAAVGLIGAIRRCGRPAARWAVTAFAVMLLPGMFSLSLIGLRWLESRGNTWVTPWLDWPKGLMGLVPHLFRAAGFVLLIPAIFAGRQPVTSDDPDAG